MSRTDNKKGPVRILFDGECGLCSRTVRFFYRREYSAQFTFTPLQSECGRALAVRYGINPDNPSSFAVIDGSGHAHLKSAGAFLALRHCRKPWPLLAALAGALPVAVTDGLYDFVAAKRLRIFGTADVCELQSSELASRLVTTVIASRT